MSTSSWGFKSLALVLVEVAPGTISQLIIVEEQIQVLLGLRVALPPPWVAAEIWDFFLCLILLFFFFFFFFFFFVN